MMMPSLMGSVMLDVPRVFEWPVSKPANSQNQYDAAELEYDEASGHLRDPPA